MEFVNVATNNDMDASRSQDPVERLELMRKLLAENNHASIIIGSSDAHMSEYVPLKDKRREWISGFTGSAGTVVVTAKCALLWTDGRYFTQASSELGEAWTLMRSGESGVPTLEAWIGTATKNPSETGIERGCSIAVDPMLMSIALAKSLEDACKKAGASLAFTQSNLVDSLWTDQPPAPCTPVQVHPLSLAGQSIEDKLTKVRGVYQKAGAEAIVVTALDEVAWLFNIRAADIEYNPVAIAFATVTDTEVSFYINPEQLSAEVEQHLGTSIKVQPYTDILQGVEQLVQQNLKVGYDSLKCNFAIVNSIPSELRVELDNPISLLKSLKNAAELEGIRQAHIRDGVALTSFLAWLENAMLKEDGDEFGWPLTEVTACNKLDQMRGQAGGFVSLSFENIAGYGSNGAIIHYKADEKSCAVIGKDSLLLLDTGGQYVDGTTDITRTLFLAQDEPPQKFKEAFTRVLKGHIALARAVFPEETAGSRLDAFARQSLWEAGLDYRHGTGHGVGAFLNVHEGPQGISLRPLPGEKGLQSGMTITIEPGYYEENHFGVRIENVYIVKDADTPNHFGGKKFCTFEAVSLCPIQKKLIDTTLLSPNEIVWINDYHSLVRKTLLPQIENFYAPGGSFLIRETEPFPL